MTNVNLSKLLYAPEVDYKDLQSHGQGTRISVQGRVKKVQMIKIFFQICLKYKVQMKTTFHL